MQKYLQEISSQLKDNNEYDYIGNSDNGIWKDGKLVSKSNENSYEVSDGIPRFVKPEDETWGTDDKVKNSEDLKYWFKLMGISHKELIEFNFNKSSSDDDLFNFVKPVISEILAKGGIILECACGPAGGLTPFILRADPNARIIMNDKSFWILNEWRLLNQKKCFRNLSFALFDLTNSPLKDNSFDIISSYWGVSSIGGGDTQLGLNECYRMLKSNGKMFLYEVEISDETLASLNEDKLKNIKTIIEHSEKYDIDDYHSIVDMIKNSLSNQIEKAGFVNISVEKINQQKPDPMDGDIPGIFHKAGIELIYNLKKIVAEK